MEKYWRSIWTREVKRFFDDSSLAGDVQPRAVVLMGGVCSGKTHIRREKYSHGYVLIDAPEIFLSLSRGSYLPFPGPLEEPLRLIGQYVTYLAIKERCNVVTELIGGDMAKLKELTNALSGAGYKTELVFVECSLEVEIERNENRGENNISAHYAEPFHIEWIVNACEHRDE